MNATTNPHSETAVGSDSDRISLPRWIVYFQGALLGVVAATFFIFGMMVGGAYSTGGANSEKITDCRVSGEVWFQTQADEGAVVLLLPVDRQPAERVDPRALNPSRFEPLENPAISLIHELGGAVTRIDDRGKFEVLVDSPGAYHVVAISNNSSPNERQPLRKDQKATLGTYFRPIENLIDEQAYSFSRVQVDGDSKQLPVIRF